MLKLIKIATILIFLPLISGIKDNLKSLKNTFGENEKNIALIPHYQELLSRTLWRFGEAYHGDVDDIQELKRINKEMNDFKKLKEVNKIILSISAPLASIINTSRENNKAEKPSEIISTFMKPNLRKDLALEIASYIYPSDA